MKTKHKALVIALLIIVSGLVVNGFLAYRNAGVSATLLPPLRGFVLIEERALPLREVRFPNFLPAQQYTTASIQPLLKAGDIIEIDLSSDNVKSIYANAVLVGGEGLWLAKKKTQVPPQIKIQSNLNIYLDVIPPWGTGAKIKVKITEVVKAEATHEKISPAILKGVFEEEIEGFYVKEVYWAIWLGE